MKIISCFTSLKEIAPLAAAGAAELYCAVNPLPSFGESLALKNITEFKQAAAIAHDLGLKVSVAVNSLRLQCDSRKAKRLAALCAEAEQSGADAFIISNLSALNIFADHKFRPRAALHLSSVQPCFNSLSAAFFIRSGFSRLILPNQLAPQEAKALLALCRKKGVETEIFDYRFFGCAYINGHCHMHTPWYHTLKFHSPEGSLCRVNIPVTKHLKPVHFTENSNMALMKTAACRLSGRLACGGAPRMANPASFFDFFTAGIQYLKYGVRQDTAAAKIRKVKELRYMADLAKRLKIDLGTGNARKTFVKKMTAWDGSTEKFSHAD